MRNVDARSLSPAVLAERIALANSDRRWHKQMLPFAAATITGVGTETLPSGFVPLDAWRMHVLTRRVVSVPRQGLRYPIAMATYKPVVDLVLRSGVVVGTGRVKLKLEHADNIARFHQEQDETPEASPAVKRAMMMLQSVEDRVPSLGRRMFTLPEVYWFFESGHGPVYEQLAGPDGVRFSRAEFENARRDVNGGTAWPARFFARRWEDRFTNHPVSGSTDPWRKVPSPVGEESTDWVLRDGTTYPSVQAPDKVLVDLTPFQGRTTRHPAFGVLQRQNLIAVDTRYGAWVRAMRDNREAGTYQSLHLESITQHVQQNPGVQTVLEQEIMDALENIGLDLAEIKADIFASWLPVELPDQGRIEVIELDGGQPDPDRNLVCAGSVYDVDFYDLGHYFEQATAEQISADRVSNAARNARRQQRKRSVA